MSFTLTLYHRETGLSQPLTLDSPGTSSSLNRLALIRRSLAARDLTITDSQYGIFWSVANGPLSLVEEDSLECLGERVSSQYAVDRYFALLDEVRVLDPQSTLEEVVAHLAGKLGGRLAGLLLLAVHCNMFSLEVAHEAYRQLMLDDMESASDNAEIAIDLYRMVLARSDQAVKQAGRAG